MRNVFLCVFALALCAAPAGAMVWEWDCGGDPTPTFVNRDGTAFDMGELNGDGTWTPTITEESPRTDLDTVPQSTFNNPVSVDLRWKALGGSDWDAFFWINTGFTETTMEVMYGFLTTDGESQTFAMFNVIDPGWNTVPLGAINGLANDFIDMKLYIDPEANTISVTVDSVDKGTFTYGEKGDPHTDKFATIGGGNVEFDHVRIEEFVPTGLEGDVNDDCVVNILDLIAIRNHLNEDPSTPPGNAAYDVNEDGSINILDMIFVRNRLNTSCPE